MNLQIKSVVRLCSYVASQRSLNIQIRNVVAGKKYFSSCLQKNESVYHPETNYSNPWSPQHGLKVLSKHSCCHDYTQRRQKATAPQIDSQWIPIYHFKQVIICRFIQRFKILQTAFSLIMTIPVVVLNASGVIPSHEAAFVIGGAVFTSCMLFVVGKISERVIGFIYTSNINPSVVRIAHLDFWGNRVDDIVDIQDIIPITETLIRPGDQYIPIRRCSDEKATHYITLKYGIVYAIEEFEEIFGTIPDFLIDNVKSNQQPLPEHYQQIKQKYLEDSTNLKKE